MNGRKIRALVMVVVAILAWLAYSFVVAWVGTSQARATSAPILEPSAEPTTTPEEVVAVITCRMTAYVLVQIEETSPMIFIYVAQGKRVEFVATDGVETLIIVPIGGQEFTGRVPVDAVADCEAG